MKSRFDKDLNIASISSTKGLIFPFKASSATTFLLSEEKSSRPE
jgi:hypothetical protein